MDTNQLTTPLAQRPGIHLALGGGSARGLAHLGILKAFQDHHIPIASIAGTSMGSLVGASFALLGKADDVIKHFQEHVRSDQFNQARYAFLKEVTRRNREDRGFNLRLGLKRGFLLSQSYTKGSIISYDEFLREINALIPNKTFKATRIPFFALSVDLLKTKEIVFNEGYLRSAILASSAIPGLFPPIRSGETIYIDGGWMNKVPVTPLLNFGATRVLAINVGDSQLPELNPKRGTHLMRMADLASQIRLQQLQVKDAPLLWEPNLLELNLMDFAQVEHAVEVGYKFAITRLDEVKALCEPPKSLNLKQRFRHWLNPLANRKTTYQSSFEIRGIWDVGPLE